MTVISSKSMIKFHSQKPHGTFAAQPQLGAYILREPNGIPDLILFGSDLSEQVLQTAANTLSVQGYTVRIVIVTDIDTYLSQTNAYQSTLFSDAIPFCIGLWDSNHFDSIIPHAILFPTDTSTTELSKSAVKLLCQR